MIISEPVSDKIFKLKTSDIRDAVCTLYKKQNDYNAILTCTVNNTGRNFI